jgi:acetyl-CoA acetyltransferase
MMSLNGAAAVAGIGETAYERRSAQSAEELQFASALAAIGDAGLVPADIDGVIPIGITGAPAEEFVTNLGLPDLRFSALIPHGGASGIGALQCAAAVIAAGICRTVLVAAGRNVSSGWSPSSSGQRALSPRPSSMRRWRGSTCCATG